MGVISKSERGFRLLAGLSRRVQKAEKIRLRDTMSNGEAFAAIVQSCLRHFRLNEPLIARDMNALALHQARVAMRRLRSALTLFRPAVSDGELSSLRNQLRWFTDKLGEARNLDVLLAAKPIDGADPEPAIRKRLRRSRKEAYLKVQAALAEPRLAELILALVAWSESGGWREGETAREPVRRFAGEQLERSWKRVRKRAKHLRFLTPDDRHGLRIQIKRLRYAAEFFVGLAPKSRRPHQKRFVAAARDLQELLGHLNDLETRRQLAPQLLPDEREFEAEVARLLGESERAFESLREIGPYWR
jgi:inorganic triphosphatase YgiF